MLARRLTGLVGRGEAYGAGAVWGGWRLVAMSCSGCSMRFPVRVPGEPCGHEAGGKHEYEHDHHKGPRW